MTPHEQPAFVAGIQAARQAALTAAVTIKVRDDIRTLLSAAFLLEEYAVPLPSLLQQMVHVRTRGAD